MREDPDQYIAFLYAPEGDTLMSLEDFCINNVEPMGKEAGMCSEISDIGYILNPL